MPFRACFLQLAIGIDRAELKCCTGGAICIAFTYVAIRGRAATRVVRMRRPSKHLSCAFYACTCIAGPPHRLVHAASDVFSAMASLSFSKHVFSLHSQYVLTYIYLSRMAKMRY